MHSYCHKSSVLWYPWNSWSWAAHENYHIEAFLITLFTIFLDLFEPWFFIGARIMSPQWKRLLARCVIQQQYVALREALRLWWWLWMWWRWSGKNDQSPSLQISSLTRFLPLHPLTLACLSYSGFLSEYTAVPECFVNTRLIGAAAWWS